MTMGWMETIRFIGLDLQVATVFAVAGLDWAARAPWSEAGRVIKSWVTRRTSDRTRSSLGTGSLGCDGAPT